MAAEILRLNAYNRDNVSKITRKGYLDFEIFDTFGILLFDGIKVFGFSCSNLFISVGETKNGKETKKTFYEDLGNCRGSARRPDLI